MEKIALRRVAQTTNYALFVMHDQNRVILDHEGFKPRKDLLESMKKTGFLETGHIICTLRADGKLEIVEGHNRFITAKHLGIPVWYSAHPANDAVTPVKHNQTIRTWGVKDFAGGHSQDNADYAEVMAFHRKTKIPLMACFTLFAGQTAASSSNVNRAMKQGQYKIKNRDLPSEVGTIVLALAKHCDFAASINLVNAISRAVFAKGFDSQRMVERIAKKPELIKRCNKSSDYELMLETLYNHGVKSGRLYLRTEIEKAMRARNIGLQTQVRFG